METLHYDALRHFADSWGLLYMMGIFLVVVFLIVRPGARGRAIEAANIPLDDDAPRKEAGHD
jgi:cytochrome c oxidase cbb3-type subunit 4